MKKYWYNITKIKNNIFIITAVSSLIQLFASTLKTRIHNLKVCGGNSIGINITHF